MYLYTIFFFYQMSYEYYLLIQFEIFCLTYETIRPCALLIMNNDCHP